jgi:integrase/recombinase XerD
MAKDIPNFSDMTVIKISREPAIDKIAPARVQGPGSETGAEMGAEGSSAPEWISQFADWLRISSKPGKTLEESSIQSYCFDLGHYSHWYFETTLLSFHPSDCNRVDFRGYQKACEHQHVAPATWNRRMTALKKLSRWAQAMGWIHEDAARDLTRMEMAQLAPHWLTESDRRRFVRQLETDINRATTPWQCLTALRNRAICLLMLNSGLRESEVIHLRCDDITIRERSGEGLIYDSKRAITGSVPLSVELRRAMVEYMRDNPGRSGTAYVFPGDDGEDHLCRRTIQRVVAEVGKRAGIEEDVTPHRLRHTCCHLVERAKGLTMANRLMRHKSMSTTMRYAMPSMDELQAAVDEIEI